MRSSTVSALSFGILTSLVAPASAFWRMGCGGVLVKDRADPVVNPGAVAGHVHNILGGSAFDFTMDYEKTQTSVCTSCEIKKDLSNYWVPSLYFAETNGKFTAVNGGGTTVYYLQRPGRNDKEGLKAFPKGFRMLAGNPYKRSGGDDAASKAVSFVCLGGSQPEQGGLPTQNCPQGLRAQIFFPSCWDGVNLDSPDHKSHVAYPIQNFNGGDCPSTHPVHLISIFYETIWSVNDFKDKWAGRQQPFVFSMGDPTGFGYHGDFVNGWDVEYLQKAVDTCTANSGSTKDCPVFGNGGLQDGGAQNACKISPRVQEEIFGTLDALPGCNPIQKGPGLAVKPTDCTSSATIGEGDPGFKDVTSKGWGFQGCAADNYYERSLDGPHNGDKAMTVEKCIETCGTKGYSLAGLQYSSECWCGNNLKAGREPVPGIMGACQMKCSGDDDEVCGGPGALSLYKKCGGGTCTNVGGSTGTTPSGSGSSSSTPAATSPAATSPTSPSGTATPGGNSPSPTPDPSASSSPSSSSGNMPPARGDPSQSGKASTPAPSSTPKGSASPSPSPSKSPSPSASPSPSPSPSSTPGSTPPKVEGLPAGWNATGCYVDNLNPRTLPEWAYYGKPNTNAGCVATCNDRKFKYAGTEHGSQCFCGNTLAAAKAPQAECNMPCVGNAKEICGGPARLTVFTKGVTKRSMRVSRRRS